MIDNRRRQSRRVDAEPFGGFGIGAGFARESFEPNQAERCFGGLGRLSPWRSIFKVRLQTARKPSESKRISFNISLYMHPSLARAKQILRLITRALAFGLVSTNIKQAMLSKFLSRNISAA